MSEKKFRFFLIFFKKFTLDAKIMLEAVYNELTIASALLHLFSENMHISSKMHTQTYTSNFECKIFENFDRIFFLFHTCNRPGIIPRNQLSNLSGLLDPFGTCPCRKKFHTLFRTLTFRAHLFVLSHRVFDGAALHVEFSDMMFLQNRQLFFRNMFEFAKPTKIFRGLKNFPRFWLELFRKKTAGFAKTVGTSCVYTIFHVAFVLENMTAGLVKRMKNETIISHYALDPFDNLQKKYMKYTRKNY